jgi:hypothetical protein
VQLRYEATYHIQAQTGPNLQTLFLTGVDPAPVKNTKGHTTYAKKNNKFAATSCDIMAVLSINFWMTEQYHCKPSIGRTFFARYRDKVQPNGENPLVSDKKGD